MLLPGVVKAAVQGRRADQLSWNNLSSMGNWGVQESLWLEIKEWLSLERTS